MKEVYRFRIRDYRLFYKIDEQESMIFVLSIENRQDAYKLEYERSPNKR